MIDSSQFIKNPEAYKEGSISAMRDWRLVGDHSTRENPYKDDDSRLSWVLGRNHGFQEAQQLIETSNITKHHGN